MLAINVVGFCFYAGFEWLLGRRARLVAVCENGLVGTHGGVTVFTPWSSVKSLSAFRVHTGFDIHAGATTAWRAHC